MRWPEAAVWMAVAVLAGAVVSVMIWAGTVAGKDTRQKSIECVKVGGSWSRGLDRCDSR